MLASTRREESQEQNNQDSKTDIREQFIRRVGQINEISTVNSFGICLLPLERVVATRVARIQASNLY